jgi:conjugative transposon TraN protein
MKSILLTLSLLVSGFISIKATPFTSSPLALDGAALTRTIVRPVLYVNETITTHLVMPENIKLVDLSTDKIAGNQCADNIVRLKPSSAMENQQFIGTVTLVGERNIALYDLLYTKNPKEAATLYYVPTQHLSAYQNPSVKMPSKEIAQYAWAIFCSDRKFYNIKSKAYGISMRVNNIYSVGDYFFIDFSLHNHTNVKYDIEELRVKLMDKKETKATNSQTIELTPEYLLFDTKTFKKDYRNVLVLKKLTFPEEKILQIEIYESQISGRTLQIPISYEDVLHADAISEDVINNLPTR